MRSNIDTNNKTLTEKWLARIKDYRKSGQTQSEYSKSKGFPAHQLSYWIRRLEEKLGLLSREKKSAFVPVQVESDSNRSTHSKPYCQLSFDNGGVIAIENKQGLTRLCELVQSE